MTGGRRRPSWVRRRWTWWLRSGSSRPSHCRVVRSGAFRVTCSMRRPGRRWTPAWTSRRTHRPSQTDRRHRRVQGTKWSGIEMFWIINRSSFYATECLNLIRLMVLIKLFSMIVLIFFILLHWIYLFVWRQTGSFLRPWCRSSGNARFSNTAWGMSFFVFFIATVTLDLLLAVAKNSKPVMYFFPGFSSLKRTFVRRSTKWHDQKSRNKILRTSYQKTHHSKFLLFACSVACQKTACGPKKTLFLRWDELGSLGLRGVFRTLTKKATNPEKSMLRCLLDIQKNTIPKLSVELFWMDDPKVLFSG